MANTHRKLTTILCADVEGYSRLMGVDEEGTHAALMRSRHAIEQHVEAHDGRLVNSWGDAFIAEFASVVEAVRAAIGIQDEIDRMNTGRPKDAHMCFRIGINLGDVIVEGCDLYGDGVNIAARLQAEAPAGGIVISRTVHDQIHTKLRVEFRSLGALTVKNIPSPVHGYSVHSALPPAQGTWDGVMRSGHPFHRLGRSSKIALLLVVVNLMTWNGTFWAIWPLLGLATAAALRQGNGRRGTTHRRRQA